MGDPGSAGEDFSDAHSTPDAHHHTPQESTADTGVWAQAVLKAVWDGDENYHY